MTTQQHKEHCKNHYNKYSGEIQTAMNKAAWLMASLFYQEINEFSAKLYGQFV